MGGRAALVCALLAIPALSIPAWADTIASPAADKVAVTLYRADAAPFQGLEDWQRKQALDDGLILVTETRTVDLPAGRHTLRFEGVADALIPQSAAIDGLPGTVVERNYDYALLSPGTLVERSLNQPVKVVRTNRRTGRRVEETAILRQGPSGLVVETPQGVEALGCGGGAEGLVFDHAPDGLTSKPSLSAEIEIPQARHAVLTLSYLATGVAWQADYVARVHPEGGKLDLTGWLTLVNGSGTSFADAPTQAVAGKLSREAVDVKHGQGRAIVRQCWPMKAVAPPPPPPPPPPPAPMAMAVAAVGLDEMAVMANRRMAEQSELGDYKLYTLPEPVTVAARQTKQVAFLDQKNVAFQRIYPFYLDVGSDYADPDDDELAVSVVLRMDNKRDLGLGKPLPAGALAVFETANGRPAFAGEQAMRDVAVGQPFELEIGQAMDVRARPRLISEQALRRHRVRRTYELDLTNAKTAPAVLEVRVFRPRDNFKIIAEPGRHDFQQGAMAWRFTLPAGGARTVRYIVEYDD